jgi:hypothetical protein
MNNVSGKRSVFVCTRQRATHSFEESETIGFVNFEEFLDIFRRIDWRHEANQAEWANKASPNLAVTNQKDDCMLYVASRVTGYFIDVDADPDVRFRADKHAPAFSIGMKNPPGVSNIVALDVRGIDDDLGFFTFSPKPVEECFEWFFNEDYRSLYARFRWV